MDGTDLSRRERLEVVADIARFRPRIIGPLIVVNVAVAVLSGVGVGFIVPIIGFVVGPDGADGGAVQQLFLQAYRLLGLPLTLETAVGGVALVVLLRYTLQLVAEFLGATLEARYVRHLRSTVFDGLLTAQIDTVDNAGEDSALNAIVTEARLAGNIPTALAGLVQSTLLVIAFGLVAFIIAPMLAILTVLILGGITAFVRFVVESGIQTGDRLAAANEAVQKASRRGTAGLREVKVFAAGDRFRDEFERSISSHADALVRFQVNRSAITIVQQAVIALAVFLLLYLGVTVYAVGPAELAAFLFAMFRAAPQLTSANKYVYLLESDLPHAIRIRKLSRELERNAEPSGGDEPVPRPVNDLSVSDVSFAYEGSGPVLDEVSLNVARGETVALAGASGAGKSTLAALLARFYGPTTGDLSVNGVYLDDLDLADWRAALGFVRQQPYIFDGTLRENLLLGRPNATDEEIRRACTAAQIDEYLDDLPNGLETELGEDAVKLSGGQRQRIAIARALLADPAVLVLDEAMSDLDSTLQTAIMAQLRDVIDDVPILIIAHRKSTVRSVDRVVVLDDGTVVERGSPEELLEQNGTYAGLYGNDDGESINSLSERT